MFQHKRSPLHDSSPILLLAAAYVITGKAGLMLAIPPGYATAIFPASGIALTAILLWGRRLWPGIVLGSLLLNLWTTLEIHHTITPITTIISLLIACGALGQTLFGAWLIQRFVGFPTALVKEKEIIRLLLLAGPVSCLLSASVGITVLWFSGSIATNTVLFSWWTWWVGDTLGILLGVPLLFCFFAQPKPLWYSRRWSVALPIAMATILIIPIFITASHWESQRVSLEFRKQAGLLHQTLESNLKLNLDAIYALRDFTNGVETIRFKGFTTFAQGILSRHPSLHAISYNPRIVAAERATFETAIRGEVNPEFSIKERDPKRGLIVANPRPEYITVAYIQPLAANRNALGFDVASNPIRKIALEQARDGGQLVLTGRITLVQETQSQAGVLAFLPIYKTGVIPSSTVEKSMAENSMTRNSMMKKRRANLQGYAVGVFRIGALLASSMVGVNQHDIMAQLFDETEPHKPPIFLAGYGNGQGLWNQPTTETGNLLTSPWWSKAFTLGERQWRLELSPSQAFLEARSHWGSWFVLAGGLLFASMLGALLLIITGRTSLVENLVQQRTKELSDSEARTRAIVDSAVNGIITISDRGIIESVNPAASRLFGYPPEEMEGRNVSMVMPSPYREFHNAYLKRYLETGEARVIDQSREVKGMRKDGSAIPLELSVSDVQLKESRIFTGILHDLTERHRADRLKNEFVSTVSHELRTPLTSIFAGLKMVLAGVTGPVPDKAKKLLTLAFNNSERLTLLINDILDIQKMESGQMDMQFKPVDAAALVQRAVAENFNYAEKFKVQLAILEPMPADLTVQGDESRLCQVLANLLSNAAKFSPEGATVTIHVTFTEPWVQFAVIDHGPGIPESFQARVFEKFAQGDSSDTRRPGGTGLGLSITKALVESHKGEIGFHSKPGEGTTFYFRLLRVQNYLLKPS